MKLQKPKPETFGFRLQQFRLQRGLTQAEIGKKIGLSLRMLSYYEGNHGRLPPVDVVMKLAKVIRVPVDDLLGADASDFGPPPRSVRLLKRLRRIEQLPRHHQRAIMEHLDALLAKRANGNGRRVTA
ncbi:MAG: hypothetical protein A3G34_17495 [Candidatus Lindowbacteria bacterium RIFCSPLOWO2_12_FULL_62_27]|nr:MAG: hypothetical protein A3G34_17495 [Candidatus Lindowbacteria bacterium RIFCSPLOWO2_12_FULL_62_27]